MSTGQRILKNTSVQIIGQVLHLILSISLLAIVARYLRVELFGRYSLIFVIISFFAILTDFGINDIVVRELSCDRSKTSRIILDLLAIKTILGLLVIGLSVTVVTLLKLPQETRHAFILASLSLLFISLSSTGTILFRVNLWMERAVIASTAKDLALLLLTAVAISLQWSLNALVLAHVVANLVNLIFVLLLMRKILHRPESQFDINFWKAVLRHAAPLGLAYVVVNLYMAVDNLMLERLVNEEAVGFYNASYKFVYQAIVIPVALANSLFPFMSEYWQSNRAKLLVLFQRSFDYMVLISIPMAMSVTVVAPKLILLIFGPEYTQSILPLRILIWGVALMFPGIILGYMMVALHQQRKSLIVDSWGLLVNVGLNLLFIPLFSFVGASIVTVITEICVLTPTIFIIMNKLETRLSPTMVLKSLVVGLLCATVLYITDSWNLFIQLPLVMVVYLSIVYLMGLIPREDMHLLLQKTGHAKEEVNH